MEDCREEQHQIFLNNRNTYREYFEKEIVNITLKDAYDVEKKILNELGALKYWILNKLPEVKIVFSCPTIRHDDQKA